MKKFTVSLLFLGVFIILFVAYFTLVMLGREMLSDSPQIFFAFVIAAIIYYLNGRYRRMKRYKGRK